MKNTYHSSLNKYWKKHSFSFTEYFDIPINDNFPEILCFCPLRISE